MATPASRTVPASPNPSAQGSPRTRDWSSLRTGEPGSAFRGISRGRGTRGGSARGGRGGGHPPSTSGQRGNKSLTDPSKSTPPPSDAPPSKREAPPPRKPPVPSSTPAKVNGSSDRVANANGSAERGGRSKPGSRKPSRAGPAVVATPAATSEVAQSAPPTPSRSANRRHRSQTGKTPTTPSKPSVPLAVKLQKSRSGSTPPSQVPMRKDVPPHLAAAHEAGIRHDIDALVERVRAVAMAENRPTTPGSHIDWAGDEDDSLPDLDDWGVTTTHTNASRTEDHSKEISPILADTLKPLPAPQSETYEEEEREMETYDTLPEEEAQSPEDPPCPTNEEAIAPPPTEKAPDRGSVAPGAEETPSLPPSEEKPPSHSSLPLKPVAAMDTRRARGKSINQLAGHSTNPSPLAEEEEEPLASKVEGIYASMYAPSKEELVMSERVSSASSSEHGLAASMHAPVPGLPESHSAPSLLPSNQSPPASRTHSRSQTEGRSGRGSLGSASHRGARSGASSPLGKHVYSHSRNHSTPAGGAALRAPQPSRPVITGEAISRLARTIGGIGPNTRPQAIPATKDSTISS